MVEVRGTDRCGRNPLPLGLSFHSGRISLSFSGALTEIEHPPWDRVLEGLSLISLPPVSMVVRAELALVAGTSPLIAAGNHSKLHVAADLLPGLFVPHSHRDTDFRTLVYRPVLRVNHDILPDPPPLSLPRRGD